MTKSEFAQVFEQAAVRCFEFAQELVSDQLPRSLRFNLRSGILETLDSGRVKFIGGRILLPEQVSGVEGKQAGQWLWVDGKIPVWINLVVSGYDEDHTFIDVFFNRSKLTSQDSQLRYGGWGLPPFHILGPSGAEIGKKIRLSPHLSGDEPVSSNYPNHPMTQKLQIKTESLPQRCEICHQADCFEASSNFCSRCADVRLPNLKATKSKKWHIDWLLIFGCTLCLGFAGASFVYIKMYFGYVDVEQRIKFRSYCVLKPGELHRVAGNFQLDEVVCLLGKDPDLIQAKDQYGREPLHWVAIGEVRVDGAALCFQKLEPPADQWMKRTALFLLDKGADVNAKDSSGRTPLHYAVLDVDGVRGPTIELLVSRGADVNCPDNEGNTPLHFAAKGQSLKNVKILLDHGAKTSLKNKLGETPLDRARLKEMVDLLWAYSK